MSAESDNVKKSVRLKQDLGGAHVRVVHHGASAPGKHISHAPPGGGASPLRLVRVGAFLGVIVLIGAILGYTWKHESGKRAAQAARDQELRVQSAREIYAAVRQGVDRVVVLEQEIRGYSRTISAAVPSLAPSRAEALPKSSAPPPTQRPLVAGNDGPPGDLTREQLDRLRGAKPPPPDGAAAGTNAAPAVTNAPPAPAALPPATRPVPKTGKSAIETLAATVQEETEAAVQDLSTARQIDSRAKTLHDQIAAGYEPAMAGERLQQLKGCVTAVQDLVNRLQPAIEVARKGAAETIAALAKLEADRTRERSERLKREEEQKSRLQIGRERDAAAASQKTCLELAKRLDFAEALRRLGEEQAGCQSEEGRQAYALLVERYTRMKSLHTFIVEQIAAQPLRWGWIQDGSPRDVLGADAAAVRTTGRTIPWAQVSTAQMMHFVKQYTSNAKLPRKVRAEQSLSAAVYCAELGGTSAAVTYAGQAVDQVPGLEETRNRLLPDLPKGP